MSLVWLVLLYFFIGTLILGVALTCGAYRVWKLKMLKRLNIERIPQSRVDIPLNRTEPNANSALDDLLEDK